MGRQSNFQISDNNPQSSPSDIVPHGTLRKLKVIEIKPSASNPRMLFDEEPLKVLRESIRRYGVLVPITVYKLPAQDKYGIVDGERRYRCCVQLMNEGLEIEIPANIVDPPDSTAQLLYMFNIHNFREQWELMPTALSLEKVMNLLGERDKYKLSKLTGLSVPQIERCMTILKFPKRFQDMSLVPDSRNRIPSNFWVEVDPVLELCEKEVPNLVAEMTRDGITDNLVTKYRNKRIVSVLHFRRILEAFDVTQEPTTREQVLPLRLQEYITDVDLETRAVFDEFISRSRHFQDALKACEDFIRRIDRAKVEHVIGDDRTVLTSTLGRVKSVVEELLTKLEGDDQPVEVEDGE